MTSCNIFMIESLTMAPFIGSATRRRLTMRVVKQKKPENKEISFTLRLNSELRDQLRKVAVQNEVSLNLLITTILKSAINDKDFLVRI